MANELIFGNSLTVEVSPGNSVTRMVSAQITITEDDNVIPADTTSGGWKQRAPGMLNMSASITANGNQEDIDLLADTLTARTAVASVFGTGTTAGEDKVFSCDFKWQNVSINPAVNGVASLTASGNSDGAVVITTYNAPDFTPIVLPAGQNGVAYSQQLTASGGTGSKTFTAPYVLPAGLTLTSGGLLAGTPTETGSHVFDVTVTDSANPAQSKTRRMLLTIAAP